MARTGAQAAAEEAAPIMPSRAPSPKRRVLAMLAESPAGATEAMMTAHGFPTALLVKLVRAGLATATTERMVAGGRTMQVARIRITDAGRRVLDAGQKVRR